MIDVRMRGFALTVVIASAGFVAACGGNGTSSGTPCSDDSACVFGQVCGGSATCIVLPCTSSGDCLNGSEACVTVAQTSVCAAVECNCATCTACPLGETCNNGVCGTTSTGCTGSGQGDCDANEICDNQTCRPCQGAECPATDCTTTGCDPNYHCDTVSKTCKPDQTTTGDACGACTSVDECGGSPWKCAPLISGNACLPACSSNDDCQTGWLCQAGNCTPSNFNCATCMGAGCSAGNACNPNSGACVAATAKCESCGNDWECGDGNACYQGKCAPRCDHGSCATGGACVTSANQVQVCDGACSGSCTPACSGVNPYCVTGACVQCRNQADCGTGQSCSAAGICTGGTGSCQPPTPYTLGDTCVACLSNDQCNGLFCNSTTHTCQSDVCASCNDPYPACTQIGTDFYCVQCGSDTDCGLGGHCNLSTFACEGGTVTNTDPCTSDADCDDGGVSGYTLRCDQPTGYCYDVDGKCDSVTGFCPGTDGQIHPCKSLLDLFGGAGGLPPEFSGGATIPGNCACSVGTCIGVTCSKGLFDGFMCLSDPDPITCLFTPPANDGGLCGSQL